MDLYTQKTQESRAIPKSWLVSAKIYMSEKAVRQYVIIPQLISKVLTKFFQKIIFGASRRQIHGLMHTSHKIQESHVIPKSWLLNVKIRLK